MHTKTLLKDEIASEFQELNKMEVGSETYKTAVDCVTKLVDREIELKKVEINERELENREIENELKQMEIENEQKDRKIKNLLTGVSIATGVGLTVWGTIASFKFEKEGTITTIMGRGFINKLLPKK